MPIAGAAVRREPPPDTQRIKLGLGGECIAPKLFSVLFVLCLASAHGALDPNFGPRVHPELGSISALQRQLQEAALMGDTMLLNITNLITAGADPNGYDEQHMTPLHWAVIKGQRLCVELLLQRGAHTDVRDSSDRTPLHFVAIYGETCEGRVAAEGRRAPIGSDQSNEDVNTQHLFVNTQHLFCHDTTSFHYATSFHYTTSLQHTTSCQYKTSFCAYTTSFLS